ncbi:MAG: phage antirepressor KilAC domain-containing protein [Treponema sp.]|nr:phage antirepressor KilAC domain-containing protein [Treponema sp.]
MNELAIKVNYESDKPTVSGRELHEKLGIKTAYKDWFPRMCEYGFIEGEDFCSFLSGSTGGRPATEHQLTIEMAKQICMIQRTEIGKQYREYFIELEKKWNSPELVMARALKMANQQIERVTAQLETANAKLEEAKPKIVFADAVSASNTSILIGDLAKIIRQNGVGIGQKRLFEWLRKNGYLMKSGTSKNLPTQRSMEHGLFEVKEHVVVTPSGENKITRTTKVTPKGQIYFINKLLAENFAE